MEPSHRSPQHIVQLMQPHLPKLRQDHRWPDQRTIAGLLLLALPNAGACGEAPCPTLVTIRLLQHTPCTHPGFAMLPANRIGSCKSQVFHLQWNGVATSCCASSFLTIRKRPAHCTSTPFWAPLFGFDSISQCHVLTLPGRCVGNKLRTLQALWLLVLPISDFVRTDFP